jgi:hypothetical protein
VLAKTLSLDKLGVSKPFQFDEEFRAQQKEIPGSELYHAE